MINRIRRSMEFPPIVPGTTTWRVKIGSQLWRAETAYFLVR
jgi:hypothetical protein